MGFFDRLFASRQASPSATPAPQAPPPLRPVAAEPSRATHAATAQPAEDAAAPYTPADTATAPLTSAAVKPLLAEARGHLDAQNKDAALAIYERVLADDAAGSRADVLVTISGDLGSTGNLREITELIGPRYDAQKHGPATGLNLLQAYIALRNVDAAQHVLDLLFALDRAELIERLHGFSNAIAELMAQGQFASDGPVSPSQGPDSIPGAGPAASSADAGSAAPQVSLVTISKPIWSYGLEGALGELFPARDAHSKSLRRVSFAQLAVLGAEDNAERSITNPAAAELARLSRAIPLWLTETFNYAPAYAAVAAIGIEQRGGAPGRYAQFRSEWTPENLRQLVASAAEPLDYIFTGSLQEKSGDYTLTLRIWELRKFRERKKIVLRWTPTSAAAELTRLHEYLRQFMEWADGGAVLSYAPPPDVLTWLGTLDASLSLFLVGKNVLASEQLGALDDALNAATSAVQNSAAGAAPQETPKPASGLAALTLLARARDLGAAEPETLSAANAVLQQAAVAAPASIAPLLNQARSDLGL